MQKLYLDLEIPNLIFNISSKSSKKKPLERLSSSLIDKYILHLAKAYLNLIRSHKA